MELITAALCVLTIQYANSVFKALRIETEEDLHKLVKFFIRKAEGKRPDTESTLSEEDNSWPQLIYPNEVPQALRMFIEHKHVHWQSEWKCRCPLLCHVKLVHMYLQLAPMCWQKVN